jgi:hypothetical protein
MMGKPVYPHISMLLAALLAWPAVSVRSADLSGALEQKKIHSDYNEGNFESVITALEGFMRRNKTYAHGDSVFIAKHLAVVYSANPATREKGKYYMYRLLELLPSAKLVDMYVSDEIDRIFDKVREEFLARQEAFGVDSAQISLPEKRAPARDSASPGGQPGLRARKQPGMKSAYWIAGGAAALAAAIVAIHMAEERETDDKTLVVRDRGGN